MKCATLDASQVSLSEVLGAAEQNDVVFVQTDGQTRFAVIPADESDEEILALRSSAEFMSYLADAERRAAAGASKNAPTDSRIVWDVVANVAVIAPRDEPL